MSILKEVFSFQPVVSGNIQSIAFKNGVLAIEFKGKFNGCYLYKGVSEDLFENLAKSNSVGKTFHSLKGQLSDFYKYEYEKEDLNGFGEYLGLNFNCSEDDILKIKEEEKNTKDLNSEDNIQLNKLINALSNGVVKKDDDFILSKV